MEFGCVYPRRVQDGDLEMMDAEASTAAVVGSPISSNRYEDLKIWAALKTGVADSRPWMRRNEDSALDEEPRARHPCRTRAFCLCEDPRARQPCRTRWREVPKSFTRASFSGPCLWAFLLIFSFPNLIS